jgi:hypothetical protein
MPDDTPTPENETTAQESDTKKKTDATVNADMSATELLDRLEKAIERTKAALNFEQEPSSDETENISEKDESDEEAPETEAKEVSEDSESASDEDENTITPLDDSDLDDELGI